LRPIRLVVRLRISTYSFTKSCTHSDVPALRFPWSRVFRWGLDRRKSWVWGGLGAKSNLKSLLPGVDESVLLNLGLGGLKGTESKRGDEGTIGAGGAENSSGASESRTDE
jgi:hypothetical protein